MNRRNIAGYIIITLLLLSFAGFSGVIMYDAAAQEQKEQVGEEIQNQTNETTEQPTRGVIKTIADDELIIRDKSETDNYYNIKVENTGNNPITVTKAYQKNRWFADTTQINIREGNSTIRFNKSQEYQARGILHISSESYYTVQGSGFKPFDESQDRGVLFLIGSSTMFIGLIISIKYRERKEKYKSKKVL